MKRITYLIASLISVSCFILTSCGEDRTYEFVAKTEVDHWIEAQMQDLYLYYKDIPSLEMEYYFYPADEFFPKILAPQDKYSYLEMNEETKTRNNIQAVTYGFDFTLINDPTGTTTHQVARVLLVMPNSPAEQAGLKRGNFITAINGETVNNNNASKLQSGNGITITTSELGTDSETLNTIWNNNQTITLNAAISMENDPFFTYKVIENTHIGYLAYNEFKAGKDENNLDDTSYMQKMLTVFSFFKNQGITDLILDLRYNHGGYVACAQEMASMIVPANMLGQEFAHFEYNDKHPELNKSIAFLTNLSDYNLNLSRLYIISGIYTASASEMMINCLRPYMDVYVLGTETKGKNVAMDRIESPYNFTMYPVCSVVYNKNNQSDYSNGFAPDYRIDEFKFYPWKELGDSNELLLYNTLQLIAGNTPPNAEQTENPEETKALQVSKIDRNLKSEYSSFAQKHIPKAILTK